MSISTLGERIAKARKKAGMTQKELADWLRIDYATINRYEKDRRIPDATVIGQIANFLKCDLEWLVLGFEPTNSMPGEVVPRARHIESFTPEEREYIEKLTAIIGRAAPEDIAYMKGVLDTLATKSKEKAKTKKGA